ncbi:MAG: hypothetical protein QXM16_00820 [Nitrososphaerota archaeon]
MISRSYETMNGGQRNGQLNCGVLAIGVMPKRYRAKASTGIPIDGPVRGLSKRRIRYNIAQ